MVDIRRVKIEWTAAAGGSGLSVFYTDSSVDVTTELQTFFGAIKSRFPSGVTWSCAGSGDMLESTTGELTGGWSGGTSWTDSGSAGAVSYAAGVGAMVRWNTDGIVGGRRLRGRTFLCPIESVNYDSSGTIVTACLTNFQTAANTLETAGKLIIWHRPTPGGADGVVSQVTSAVVPDRVAWLRTRRS